MAKYITRELLDQVSAEAKASDRKRMNYNFHESMEAPVHRLLNALEPKTYIPPHRHTRPAKDEMIILLRGKAAAFRFDDSGNIREKTILDPSAGTYGLDIPAGEWHGFVALEPETVIYEVKAGPFLPLCAEDTDVWAPSVNHREEAERYNRFLISQLDVD